MTKEKESCLYLSILWDTLSNNYWTYCQMIIEYIVQLLLDTLS